MTDIVCTDPDHGSRPDEPGWSAVLGETDLDESPPDVLCAACARHVDPPATETGPDTSAAAIAAARASLAAATTVLQVRARTLALIDLLTTGDTP